MTQLISGATNTLLATLQTPTGGNAGPITGAYSVSAAVATRDGVRKGGPYTLTGGEVGASWATTPPIVAVPIQSATLVAALDELSLPQLLCEIRVQMTNGGAIVVYRTGLSTVLKGALP